MPVRNLKLLEERYEQVQLEQSLQEDFQSDLKHFENRLISEGLWDKFKSVGAQALQKGQQFLQKGQQAAGQLAQKATQALATPAAKLLAPLAKKIFSLPGVQNDPRLKQIAALPPEQQQKALEDLINSPQIAQDKQKVAQMLNQTPAQEGTEELYEQYMLEVIEEVAYRDPKTGRYAKRPVAAPGELPPVIQQPDAQPAAKKTGTTGDWKYKAGPSSAPKPQAPGNNTQSFLKKAFNLIMAGAEGFNLGTAIALLALTGTLPVYLIAYFILMYGIRSIPGGYNPFKG